MLFLASLLTFFLLTVVCKYHKAIADAAPSVVVASYAAVFSVAPSLSPHKRLWGESEGATLKTAA